MQNSKCKIIINSLLIVSLLAPTFTLAQGLEQPQTIEEAESLGLKILTALPGAVKKAWQEEALPLILKMWHWAKNVWDSYLSSWVNDLWKKLLNLVGKESPDIKQEFQKEKQEMQQDLWERFKALF